MASEDLPPDYKWIDWDHMYLYVGRAIMGNHVPMMTDKVAKYLEEQAKDMRRTADKLDIAAKAMREAKKSG